MTNLATVRGGGSAGTPTLDPLPTFGIWGNFSNSPYFVVYDGVGQVSNGLHNTGSEIYTHLGSSPWYTDSSYSTATLNTAYTIGQTNFNQAEGHYAINIPAYGGYQGCFVKNPNDVAADWAFFGTLINPRGIRQKNSIWTSSTTLRKYTRGALHYYETLNWSTYANTSGTPGNTNSGMNSYNDRTKTFVIVTTGGSDTYRIHVWKHPNYGLDGSDYAHGSLKKFISDAYSGLNGASYFYNDFSWSTSGSTSYSESTLHLRVIVGDNDKVGLVRFTPSNQTINGYFTLNPSSTSTSVTTGVAMGGTTSYGIEQGSLYGLRHQLTWDNKWIITYSPYYYYGAGALMHFISTEDPTKYFYYAYNGTSSGVGISPINQSGFIWNSYDNNSDSTGLYYGIFEPQAHLERGLAVGSQLTTQYTYGGTTDASYYTSTNYPWLVAMGTWASGTISA